MAATSKREQLEALLEKAEGSQVMSTDLRTQVPNIKPVSVHDGPMNNLSRLRASGCSYLKKMWR